MGRSVNYLTGASSVVFDDIGWMGIVEEATCEICSDVICEGEATECCDMPLVFEKHYNEDHQDWDYYIDSITVELMTKYPSLSITNRWEGNEVHIFLENSLCEIAVSEYCNIASISIRPIEDEYGNTGLADRFVKYVGKWMEKNIGSLRKVGGFSDGTSHYERKE